MTSQQISRFYDSYRDMEIMFSKEIIKALNLDPRQVYIKCNSGQWPCIINSSSLSLARIIIGTKGGAYAAIQKVNTPVSLRFFFSDPNRQTMSFFVSAHVSAMDPYMNSKELAIATLTFNSKPPDDLIEIVGRLLETKDNAVKRKEERIIMTSEARHRLGIEKEDTIIYVQNVPRKCILRDLSFSGAKVSLLGVPKFVSGKETVLRIVFDDPAETLDIRGSIVGADFAEGRQDIVTASIKFDEKAVPTAYKLHINDYLTMTKKNLLDASSQMQNAPTQTVEQAAAVMKARLNAAASRGTSIQNIPHTIAGT